tara:strand:+ start:370 stop:564 length:195 start_codon:yes stop_codon:yes gene_type:complete
MAKKPSEELKDKFARSVMKHPWKWGLGAVGLGVAKFAAAGWAIGKVAGSKKKSKKEQPKKYMAG